MCQTTNEVIEMNRSEKERRVSFQLCQEDFPMSRALVMTTTAGYKHHQNKGRERERECVVAGERESM